MNYVGWIGLDGSWSRVCENPDEQRCLEQVELLVHRAGADLAKVLPEGVSPGDGSTGYTGWRLWSGGAWEEVCHDNDGMTCYAMAVRAMQDVGAVNAMALPDGDHPSDEASMSGGSTPCN